MISWGTGLSPSWRVLGLAIILGVLCVAYASPHEDTFAAGKQREWGLAFFFLCLCASLNDWYGFYCINVGGWS